MRTPTINFTDQDIEHTYLRPCYCTEDEDSYIEKSFCYVEGTKRDLNASDNKSELSENVWFEIKPPRLFTKDVAPLVAARKIYITRVMLNGKRSTPVNEDEEEKKEKINVSMKNKKSAVRFLSQVHLQ
nr:uncharacterized protein LOC111515576 [Leptinotarsa decemlineata]